MYLYWKYSLWRHKIEHMFTSAHFFTAITAAMSGILYHILSYLTYFFIFLLTNIKFSSIILSKSKIEIGRLCESFFRQTRQEITLWPYQYTVCQRQDAHLLQNSWQKIYWNQWTSNQILSRRMLLITWRTADRYLVHLNWLSPFILSRLYTDVVFGN